LGTATFFRRENLGRFEKGWGKKVTVPKIEAESQKRRDRYRDPDTDDGLSEGAQPFHPSSGAPQRMGYGSQFRN
jgi:hypothetical protein